MQSIINKKGKKEVFRHSYLFSQQKYSSVLSQNCNNLSVFLFKQLTNKSRRTANSQWGGKCRANVSGVVVWPQLTMKSEGVSN